MGESCFSGSLFVGGVKGKTGSPVAPFWEGHRNKQTHKSHGRRMMVPTWNMGKQERLGNMWVTIGFYPYQLTWNLTFRFGVLSLKFRDPLFNVAGQEKGNLISVPCQKLRALPPIHLIGRGERNRDSKALSAPTLEANKDLSFWIVGHTLDKTKSLGFFSPRNT